MGEQRAGPRLSTDQWRNRISDGVSVLAAAAAVAVLAIVDREVLATLPVVVIIYLSAWTLRCVVYALVTWYALARADGQHLAEWLRESRAARRKRVARERASLSGGPSGAVAFCVLALVVVVYCASQPALRASPAVALLAALAVVTSWVQIVMVYTVHYAREDANVGGLEFRSSERDGRPRLVDYFYLAVQVSTSFTAADVAVGSRAMRRTVTVHSIIGFVFSTATIALLVSFLIVASS